MRVALGISYKGNNYQGWQSQSSGKTLQDKLENALELFCQERIGTICAGRTDSGVHAIMQVVHFDTKCIRDEYSWIRGTNSHLPKDMAVQWARLISDEFHSRASAVSRRYAYVLYQSQIRPSVDEGRVGWTFRDLDEDALNLAASHLIGEHDFSSFRAAQCQAKSPIKNLMEISISRKGAYWRFEFEANAFLHHMIRNIMGCLILIGQGHKPPDWMKEVIAARDRRIAAPTFSPDGLYFLGPRYDPKWGIPEHVAAYDGLP